MHTKVRKDEKHLFDSRTQAFLLTQVGLAHDVRMEASSLIERVTEMCCFHHFHQANIAAPVKTLDGITRMRIACKEAMEARQEGGVVTTEVSTSS